MLIMRTHKKQLLNNTAYLKIINNKALIDALKEMRLLGISKKHKGSNTIDYMIEILELNLEQGRK